MMFMDAFGFVLLRIENFVKTRLLHKKRILHVFYVREYTKRVLKYQVVEL